ncbi:M20 metallopeptidase family protein [Paenibacillus eucommiae]|uniref:Hippurate hydrolase n=1 Tax=Paenibacillus eucommiae TaxID=1355755 RepID=A0ABS4IT70_9BACL|nr:M20 family metallopeptidase [Paenibacillus eucommiae]MBP1990769.1 hippurate hydrolase [Paenibacillus eucommiae]
MLQTDFRIQMKEEANELAEKLIAFRRDLHRFPELSLQETVTASKIAAWLSELGLDVTTRVGGYGIVADLTGGLPGPTLAMRADIDALPILEETGLPFSSENPGVMHACGHDVHTSILLGAAELLARHREQLAGKVRFIFQPAEEVLAGASMMIEDGALDGVDEIYGLHNFPTLPAGKVATKPGQIMAAIDRIEIRVEGQGGHGSMPDQCIDPIVAASAIIMGLQTAVSREISPLEPAVISIGTIQAGTANNIIPQFLDMTGTVRSFSSKVRDGMPDRISRLAEQIAAAYRCKASVTYISQVPSVDNDPACEGYLRQAIQPLIGDDNLIEALPSTGGEDFALFLQKVPGSFFFLGSGPQEGAEKAAGLHSPHFIVDEACIPLGSAIFATLALERLGNKTV